MLTLHVAAIAFWFGVLGAELVIERSRAEGSAHGFAVARNHFWIDVLLEVPAAVLVLATGFWLWSGAVPSVALTVKAAAGAVAVGANLACVVPVVLRRNAADAQRLPEVIRYSRWIDATAAVGLPAGVLALILGFVL